MVPAEYCGKQYQLMKAEIRWKRGRQRLSAALERDEKTRLPILEPPVLVSFEPGDERVNVPYLVTHGVLREYVGSRRKVAVETVAVSEPATERKE